MLQNKQYLISIICFSGRLSLMCSRSRLYYTLSYMTVYLWLPIRLLVKLWWQSTLLPSHSNIWPG